MAKFIRGDMWQRISDYLEKRRATQFLDGIYGWYDTCSSVCAIYGEALYEHTMVEQDIGVILDKADRKLFSFRGYTSQAQGGLRRHPILSRRLRKASNNIFRLRNQTTRFLIRAQGPWVFQGENEVDDLNRRQFYDRALTEAGLTARQLHSELSKEVEDIWGVVQPIIAQAQHKLDDWSIP
jgi:hypothetical protein